MRSGRLSRNAAKMSAPRGDGRRAPWGAFESEMSPMADRNHIERVRAQLAASDCDAVLIKSKAMKKYLDTLTGSGCKVLVTRERAYLILDGRYVNEAHEREHALELVEHAQGESYLPYLKRLLEAEGARRVGVEADRMLVGEYRRVAALGFEVVLLDEEIPLMRIIKDADEVAHLQRAIDLTDEIYEEVVSRLRVGMTEFEISALLHYHSYLRGAEAMSFDTIVGTGPRSALPHGRPTGRVVQPHDAVLIDFGIQYEGYQSDMTRVVFMGEPEPEMRRIYEVVLEAHLAGIDAMRAGAVAEDVDRAARDVIERAGFGENFNHGLGHGIGIGNDSELPLLRPGSKTVLANGMIMSCEPGVYVDGVGGVRIEDDVLIDGGVGRPLNHTPKELRIIPVKEA